MTIGYKAGSLSYKRCDVDHYNSLFDDRRVSVGSTVPFNQF